MTGMYVLDYYHMLGVDRSADASTIRARYQKLVLEYHPDRNASANAAGRLRGILEAYQVLSDPDRRKEYDRLRYKRPGRRTGSRQDVRRRDARAGEPAGRRRGSRQEEPADPPSGRDTLVICGFCGDNAIYDAGTGEVVCYHCGYAGPPDS